jgi:endonuclease III
MRLKMTDSQTTDEIAKEALEDLRQDIAPEVDPYLVQAVYDELSRCIAAEDVGLAKNRVRALIDAAISKS